MCARPSWAEGLRPSAAPKDVREALRRGLDERSPARLPPELVPRRFRPAAVLIVLFADGDTVRLVLTHRSDLLPSHKGEISFPGGRIEPGESALDAALREAQEEVGLDPAEVELLGELDEVWSVGGYVVRPFVGWVAARPALEADQGEIQAILLPRLQDFTLPEVHRVTHFEVGGARYPIHHYALEEAVVWGLTGGLVHRLLALLGGEDAAESNDARALRAYVASMQPDEESR